MSWKQIIISEAKRKAWKVTAKRSTNRDKQSPGEFEGLFNTLSVMHHVDTRTFLIKSCSACHIRHADSRLPRNIANGRCRGKLTNSMHPQLFQLTTQQQQRFRCTFWYLLLDDEEDKSRQMLVPEK